MLQQTVNWNGNKWVDNSKAVTKMQRNELFPAPIKCEDVT